jgi:hypothetical protein
LENQHGRTRNSLALTLPNSRNSFHFNKIVASSGRSGFGATIAIPTCEASNTKLLEEKDHEISKAGKKGKDARFQET